MPYNLPLEGRLIKKKEAAPCRKRRESIAMTKPVNVPAPSPQNALLKMRTIVLTV